MKKNKTTQTGFTLIELLVVISIMMLAFTIVLVGLNQQQIARSTRLSQNEAVTNVRKVQSYMLSSRNIGTKPVKFYTLRFSSASSDNTKYTVNAIDSDYTYHPNLESINFNNGVTVSKMYLLSGTPTNDVYPVQTPISSGCVQVAFSAPFGKIYIDAANCDSAFIDIAKNPIELIKRADKTLQITLTNARGGSATDKTIVIHGFSGRILGL